MLYISKSEIYKYLSGSKYYVFNSIGERWFDDYWMNYGKITIAVEVRDAESFVEYRGGDLEKIVKRKRGRRIEL